MAQQPQSLGSNGTTDGLIRQLSFQISQIYKNKQKIEPVRHHQRLNLNAIEYDFSLEIEVKNVFDRADAEAKAEAEIKENIKPHIHDEQQTTLTDSQVEETSDEVTNTETDELAKSASGPPPVPKRGFEKEQNENDSGVSSGGENPAENKNQFATPLQPTTTNTASGSNSKFGTDPASGSVLDIFDISRCSDPFNAAHLNSIDEKEILAQVFPPTQSPPQQTVTKDPIRPKPKPRVKSAQTNVVSSLQTVLAARQVQNQKQKSQKFSKSAMAALNSLPVIEAGSHNSRPGTPTGAGNVTQAVSSSPVPGPVMTPSIFPPESEQFGEQLVQMGYEKLVVLKSIQLFGNDQEKCIDFLSAYSDLVSSSGSSSGEILRALSVCDFSKDETFLFLQKSKRYLEMGFGHQAVRNALIRYPNEPAYVLESLMTHHSK